MNKEDMLKTLPIQIASKFELKYKQEDQNSVFCFFEGKTDCSFYRNFIDSYYIDFSFFPYICNGVGNVLRVHSEVSSRAKLKIEKNRVLFFTDKDLSDILNENRAVAENIYKTDFYSAENYLVNPYIVERVLRECFAIWLETDIKFLIEQFNKLYEVFIEKLKEISIFLTYQRMQEFKAPDSIKTNFSEIKMATFFSIEFNNNQFELRFEETEIQKLLVFLKINLLDSEQIKREVNPLLKVKEPKHYLRGHFEFFIIHLFLNSVKHYYIKTAKRNREKESSLPKIIESFGFSLDNEDSVFILVSPRVKIPDSLRKFLKENYNQLLTLRKKGKLPTIWKIINSLRFFNKL